MKASRLRIVVLTFNCASVAALRRIEDMVLFLFSKSSGKKWAFSKSFDFYHRFTPFELIAWKKSGHFNL